MKQIIFVLLCCVLTKEVHAQNSSPLETKITLRVSNERIDEVLRQIAAKGGFSFSYSPDAIAVGSRVSLNASNQSVREILNVLFDGKVLFRERRKYIILQRAPEVAEKKPEAFYLNGYVIDETTGEKLPNASIYEPVTLASAVSNKYGYYKIKLPAQSEKLRLEVRKEDYAGRSVEILSRSNTYFPITLAPDTLQPTPPPTVTIRDSIRVIAPRTPRSVLRQDSSRPQIEIPIVVVAEATDPDSIIPIRRKEKSSLAESLKDLRDGLVFALSTARQAVHVENIQDSLHRPFQASLMPFIGTNRELSGNVVNDFSLNLLAGYSLGVDMAEAGLGFNLVRGDVCCFQAAGVANVVGREVKGVQAAGVANLVIGDFVGFQTATALNITAGNFQGAQLGGVNVAGGVLEGWQLFGAMNIANRVRSGHQVGIVNYADSSATVPFGYFSFVRINGYRRLELTTDELNYGNITFKTGVRKFYNIFTLGTNVFLPNKPPGSIGYGIGTARYLGRRSRGDDRKSMLDLNFVASRVALERKFFKSPYAVHTRLSLSLERKISPRLALTVGPSLNLLFSPYTGLLRGNQSSLPSITVSTDDNGEGSTYGWIGFQAGLRLCNRQSQAY
ncbi:carboxypeptidase-like regulatory domain-containing protein [Persicitalea sp.]|uniref:carboxypeptidase-like regulatory domain-containing protein n=1 Tax=Persicitalea sp. TaxID=3100273 RepID=UPI00359372BE